MDKDVILTLDYADLVVYEDRACDAAYIDEIIAKAARLTTQWMAWCCTRPPTWSSPTCGFTWTGRRALSANRTLTARPRGTRCEGQNEILRL